MSQGRRIASFGRNGHLDLRTARVVSRATGHPSRRGYKDLRHFCNGKPTRPHVWVFERQYGGASIGLTGFLFGLKPFYREKCERCGKGRYVDGIAA